MRREQLRRLDELKKRAVRKHNGGIVFSPEGMEGESLRLWMEQQRRRGLIPVVRDEYHHGI